MQCPNCRFENLPGIDACGRCGTSLHIATAVIDVHPPRARDRRFPRFNWQGRLYPLGNAVAGIFARTFHEETMWRAPSQVAARLVVPGWSQIYLGQRVRGWIFFWTYVALLLLGLAFWGTGWGSTAIGLALAVHLSSLIDVVYTGMGYGQGRLFHCVCYAAMIGIAVYWPIGFLASRFCVPIQILQALEPMQPGDVVVYNPSAYVWSRPRPGDVVLYDFSLSVNAARFQRVHTTYRMEGPQFDRILAGPGQHVKVSGGILEIDGQPAAFKPLRSSIRLPDGTLTVPDGAYLVVASTNPFAGGNLAAELWQEAGLVRIEAIQGKLFFRKYPFNRLGFIH